MPPRRPESNGWSPNKELWDELVRLTDNLVWNNCKLDPSFKHRVPKHSGVYVICSSPPFPPAVTLKPSIVLYAGQSKGNLRSRFNEHSNNPGPLLQPFARCFFPNVEFWYTRIDEVSQIDEIEILLIETFNPPCNSIRAPGASTIIARIGESVPIGRKR